MADPNRPLAQTKYPTQYMENTSYDEDFGVLSREILSYNPIQNQLERVTGIQGNSSLVLGYDGDGNLTTIQKTVGSVTYSKTLGYTGSRLTSITVWS
jgi:hypothetical protein